MRTVEIGIPPGWQYDPEMGWQRPPKGTTPPRGTLSFERWFVVGKPPADEPDSVNPFDLLRDVLQAAPRRSYRWGSIPLTEVHAGDAGR